MADKRPRFETCACKWDEAGDDILEPCDVHSLWRAAAIREAVEAREQEIVEMVWSLGPSADEANHGKIARPSEIIEDMLIRKIIAAIEARKE